jgi:GH25 family lysozyme M1 (1,4-beta-N-acetylmuramidase)
MPASEPQALFASPGWQPAGVQQPVVHVASQGMLESLPASLVPTSLGVDVSVYTPLSQSEWNAIRASGRTFAFARASWGWGGIDSEFATHMARGQAAGLYMGAYHFEYAGYSSGHTPKAEADTFLSVARPYIAAGYLRPVLDVEWVGDNLNGLTLTQWCKQWMDYVEQQTGVEPLIYCNLPWANQLDSSIKTTDLWWAAWPANPNPQTDNPSTDG